jgi:hypothetical protein
MRRGWNNRSNPLGIVLPIIIAIIVLIIIVKVVASNLGSKTTSDNSDGAIAHALVTPKADAKMSIYMSSDTSNELKWPTKFYPSDKLLRVTSGDGDITIEGSTSKIWIEGLTEIAYNGKEGGKEWITLTNGYAWLDSPNGDLKAKLKFFSIELSPGAIAIINQNTRASNIYLLKGEATISGSASKTTITGGQMISILQSESSLSDLTSKVSPLDDFIKQSGIYNRRGWADVTVSSESSGIITGTGATTSGSGSSSGTTLTQGSAIRITYPEDEMTVDTETITIEGTISAGNISKISFGGRDATILAADKSFILKDFALKAPTNDIAYRVLDSNGISIQKGVITVNVSGKKPTIKKPDVVSYPVSSKSFSILAPVDNPHKTTEESVKIRGSFAPDLVKAIRVNSYQLQQFRAFGTSWTYNASIANGNMEEGVNEYLITYIGVDDTVLATSKIYIVKERAATNPQVSSATGTTATGSVTPKF